MEAPVFEEFDPASDCDCAGCVHWRRVMPHSSNAGLVSHPAACKALVLAAAAGTVLGIGQPTPAVAAAHGPAQPGIPAGDEPDTPQGGKAPLHGPQGRPPAKPGKPSTLTRTPATTRAEIINRAKGWVAAQVPYSMDAYWSDGYRQDCSGFVSMAWSLPGNEWTGTLGAYGVRISRDQLQPGDILLFHNPADPEKGSHVVIFGGWTDYTHTYYLAYEQTLPHTRKQATPYGYWSNSDRYLPYRYKGLDDGASGAVASSQDTKVTRYPGYAYFGYGASNAYVTQLGRLLVQRGGPLLHLGPGAALVGRGPAGHRSVPAGAGLDRGGRGRAAGARDVVVPGGEQGQRHPGAVRGRIPRAAAVRPLLASRLVSLLARGARLSGARDVPAGRAQPLCHPARKAAGQEGVRQVLHSGARPALGRGGPAQRRGVPAVPGLARRRGGRFPGPRDLAAALLLNQPVSTLPGAEAWRHV